MSSHTLSTCCVLAAALFLQVTTAAAQQILGVSPALPTSVDAITISVARPSCLYTTLGSAIQGDTINLTLDKSPEGCPPIPPDAGPFTVAVFFISPLAPGAYTVVLSTDGAKTDTRPIVVQPPATKLSLLQGRFTVSVTWTNPFSGAVAAASAVQLADGSGYFWFFGAEDVDLTIKMIGLNPTFWFFAASGTDVLFTINVTDTWLNRTVTYLSPSGVNRNILDFTSFGPP
jgi:hypothetical protein